MKILLLDIETSPNVGYFWGLFKQNISHEQVDEASYVMCWSAKWFGEDKIHFAKVQDSDKDRKPMLARMHALLEQADVVIHFNGKKFDMPVLHKEFLIHGIKPPPPYKQVDLYQEFKHLFRFESNKLANIAKRLHLGYKVAHEGFKLWTRCMKGETAAWKVMEAYNRQDVVLLENVYKHVRPWVRNHPSRDAFGDVTCCPHCGSEEFQARGYQVTKVMKYRRYQCQGTKCGAWFRSNKAISLRRLEKMVTISR